MKPVSGGEIAVCYGECGWLSASKLVVFDPDVSSVSRC
jgi:hypothetical protein